MFIIMLKFNFKIAFFFSSFIFIGKLFVKFCHIYLWMSVDGANNNNEFFRLIISIKVDSNSYYLQFSSL